MGGDAAAELLIRAGSQDVELIEAVLRGPMLRRPSRVVVDAHVAVKSPRIAAAAAMAGVPFLVDPQTHLLQDHQHPKDPWAELGYARPEMCSPADLLRSRAADTLAAGVLEHQLQHGATMLIAPYVHVGRRDDGWREVQAALWKGTRRYLDETNVRLPVAGMLALSWVLLDRPSWPQTLDPLHTELLDLGASEVMLAASRVDAGTTPDRRLAAMAAVVARLSAWHPIVAWQQGVLGLAAVAAGASGYESGIGWRERCDLPAAAARHRNHKPGGTARPVFIRALERSIPKSTLAALSRNPRLIAALTCLDPSCCPNGRRDLLSDMRAHAVTARLAALREVTEAAQPAWRWNHLAQVTQAGIDLAKSINTHAASTRGVFRVDLAAMQASLSLADHHRQTLRRRDAA